MKELRHTMKGEIMQDYHSEYLDLATQKGCPLIESQRRYTATAVWFNQVVDWLCENYPEEFKVRA